MSDTDQEEIARTVRRLVKDRSAARRAAEGGPGLDRELWGQLAELGLIGISLPEAWGGSGLGLAEECAVTEALAGFVAPVPVVSTYVANHILSQSQNEAAQRLATRLAAGELMVGVCFSAQTGLPQGLTVQSQDGLFARITGEVEDLFEGAGPDVLLTPSKDGWWAIDLSAPEVDRRETPSLDPSRRLAHLALNGAPAERVSDMPPEQALSVARVLIAAEALGVAQSALDLASAYSLERRQFGQPIGRFQAIKHKLADCLMKTEGVRSAVWGALRSLKDGLPDPTAALLAKAEGGAAAPFVAAESVQIHGAMGVTWEHDLHLLMRRAKHCQISLGSPEQHIRAISDILVSEQANARSTRPGAGRLDLGFTPSAEDEAFIAPFRVWLEENMTPDDVSAIKRGGLAARRAWQASMADAGWVGIHWPTAYGGRDASFTQQVLFYAELTKRGLPPLPGNRGLMLVGPTLIAHGSAWHKQLLEPTRRADILWAGGFSERGSGSDLASLQTRGVVDGDELVITGHKIWTSQAHIADWVYALIRTGPMVPKHDGISVVVIPIKSEGLEVRPLRRNNGDHEFNELFFDEVRVPLANVVGAMGEGWRINRTTMVGEHLTNFLGSQAAQATTTARIGRALADREAKFGMDPDLRRRVAEAWATTQIVKLHGLRNVARFTGGDNPGAEGSIQKLMGQEHDKRLFELMIDVQGAAGLREGVWTRAYLSTRASTIGGGTSEIHRNKLAERVLGMPRDPWADDELAALKPS